MQVLKFSFVATSHRLQEMRAVMCHYMEIQDSCWWCLNASKSRTEWHLWFTGAILLQTILKVKPLLWYTSVWNGHSNDKAGYFYKNTSSHSMLTFPLPFILLHSWDSQLPSLPFGELQICLSAADISFTSLWELSACPNLVHHSLVNSLHGDSNSQ